jgi:hypothetical protein
MDGRRLWQESADARQHSLHLMFPCVVLVCKPKAAVVAFQKLCSVCVGVLWTGLGAVSKAPFNAVGSILGYFGSFLICISSL